MKHIYIKLRKLVKDNNNDIKKIYFTLLAYESILKIDEINMFNKINKDYIDEKILKVLPKFINKTNINPALTFLLESYSNQKKTGTYYTPSDVSNFMVDYLIKKYTIGMKIMDPTAGTGSLILNYADVLLKKHDSFIVLKNIMASDVDELALDILKQRLWVKFLENTNESKLQIRNIINKNITNQDILKNKKRNIADQILSNPPYFEHKFISNNFKNNYKNIYANSLEAFVKLLKKNGSISVIVPISFQTTIRMQPIRKIYQENFSELFISSFGDRPDSLFKGVHQKINIVFGSNDFSGHFTTKLNIWNSSERENIFNNLEFYKNKNIENKIGSKKDEIFYNEIIKNKNTINNFINQNIEVNFFISQRIAQWSKSFLKPQKNGEYFAYKIKEKQKYLMMSIFSSNTFYYYWTIVSDGWHNSKRIIESFNFSFNKEEENELTKLGKELEKQLEKTKIKIDSKQAKYAFKHSLCTEIINKIDDIILKSMKFQQALINHVKGVAKGEKWK